MKLKEKLNQEGEAEKKKETYLINTSEHTQKDTEYNWTDRLAKWRQVQISKGAISDFSKADALSTKNVSLAVLACLQGEFKADDLQSSVENSLVKGMRRVAGLNLFDFVLGLTAID